MRLRPSARALIENAAVFAALGLVVFVIANVISFATTRNVLPPETRIGEVVVSGLSMDDAISKTMTSLAAPVTLRYLTQETPLDPATIDFRLNRVVAELQLREMIDSQQSIGLLPAFMLRQHIRRTDLPLPYLYSETKLQAQLDAIAQRIDSEPRPPQPNINSGEVAAGGDGALLNRAEATSLILDALTSNVSRTVDLPVDVIPLGTASVKSIEPQVVERLKPFTDAGNIAGVFIKDLQTGEELSINGDAAFSGAGWSKLAVATEAARMNAADASALSDIAGNGDINAINPVLQKLGNGDAQRGVEAVNAMLGRLGLRNTFLAQQFFSSARPPSIVTPANSRGDIDASPDPNAQSTVADAGVLLEMLWQCSNNEGPMLLALGDENPFTAESCQAVLDAVATTPFKGLVDAGSGNAQVVQRLNWDPGNHGASALVQAGDRSYIVSVLLHGKDALDWAVTSPIITDITRIATGFFSGQLPAQVPPITSPPNAS